MLKIADSEMAAVILNQNLWGYGEKRLGKLPPDVIVHLCNALLKKTPECPKAQIEALLEAKKRLPTPVRTATPSPEPPSPEPPSPSRRRPSRHHSVSYTHLTLPTILLV